MEMLREGLAWEELMRGKWERTFGEAVTATQSKREGGSGQLKKCGHCHLPAHTAEECWARCAECRDQRTWTRCPMLKIARAAEGVLRPKETFAKRTDLVGKKAAAQQAAEQQTAAQQASAQTTAAQAMLKAMQASASQGSGATGRTEAATTQGPRALAQARAAAAAGGGGGAAGGGGQGGGGGGQRS